MSESTQILVVDDEHSVREMISILLRREGYAVTSASSGEKAVGLLKAGERYDLVITDLAMHRGNGMEVLEAVKERDPHCPVILITAFGSTESAVEAMKKGAHDYIAKPFNVEEFTHIVNQAIAHRTLIRENIDLKRRMAESRATDDVVSHSEAMKQIITLSRKVASGASSVMLSGESGTGKEVIARFIHNSSDRRNRPFVAINCGALPEPLMESELFGHRKGAFTGATEDKAGLFKAADSGTLFLDEVGDLPLSLQVKLLRVLQERTVRAVGASKETPVNVRIISATNRNIEDDVKTGRFRTDLYYRLNVISISIPPLRQRPEDIKPLINRLLPMIARENNSEVKGLDPSAMKCLLDYSYPGNVRELKNILERAVALCSTPLISRGELPQNVSDTAATISGISAGALEKGFNLDEELKKLETAWIEAALGRTGGIQSAAAELLGITVRSLRYRMKKETEDADEKDQ